MAKTFSAITQNGPLVVAGGQKTTLVNASSSNVFLYTDEVKAALEVLPYEGQQAILNSLYSIVPGANKSLATGSYNLAFAMPVANLVVLLVEN